MNVVLAFIVLLLGAVAGVPGIAAVGVVLVAIALARSAWRPAGSAVVAYERRLASDRAVCGDEIGLAVTVHNRGPLPLPWVRTLDALGHGVRIHRRGRAGPAAAAPRRA